mgnify:CR=1 FL=1
MQQGRIIIITGSPGTGKTTTSTIFAKESSMEKSVHMHTDDFYHYLSKEVIPPHLPESNEQNLIVIEAFIEAAKRYVRGGYEVHYIILRASKEETLRQAVNRSKLDRETNIELVDVMWEQFNNLGLHEQNIIDSI